MVVATNRDNQVTSTSLIRLRNVTIAAAGVFILSASSGFCEPAPDAPATAISPSSVSCDSVMVRSTVWSTSRSLRATQAPAAHPVVVEHRELVNCKPNAVASGQDATHALR